MHNQNTRFQIQPSWLSPHFVHFCLVQMQREHQKQVRRQMTQAQVVGSLVSTKECGGQPCCITTTVCPYPCCICCPGTAFAAPQLGQATAEPGGEFMGTSIGCRQDAPGGKKSQVEE